MATLHWESHFNQLDMQQFADVGLSVLIHTATSALQRHGPPVPAMNNQPLLAHAAQSGGTAPSAKVVPATAYETARGKESAGSCLVCCMLRSRQSNRSSPLGRHPTLRGAYRLAAISAAG